MMCTLNKIKKKLLLSFSVASKGGVPDFEENHTSNISPWARPIRVRIRPPDNLNSGNNMLRSLPC